MESGCAGVPFPSQEIVNRGCHTHRLPPPTHHHHGAHSPTEADDWPHERRALAPAEKQVALSRTLPSPRRRKGQETCHPGECRREKQAAECQAHAALAAAAAVATRKRQDVPRRHAAVMCEGISCVRGILARSVGRTGLGYSAVICSLRSPGTTQVLGSSPRPMCGWAASPPLELADQDGC